MLQADLDIGSMLWKSVVFLGWLKYFCRIFCSPHSAKFLALIR